MTGEANSVARVTLMWTSAMEIDVTCIYLEKKNEKLLTQ